MYFIEILIR